MEWARLGGAGVVTVAILEAVARVERPGLPLVITPSVGAVGVRPPPWVEGRRQLLGQRLLAAGAIGA